MCGQKYIIYFEFAKWGLQIMEGGEGCLNFDFHDFPPSPKKNRPKRLHIKKMSLSLLADKF
jgi:hypothetical protein